MAGRRSDAKTTLVLHVDLNRTCLMSDSSGNRSMEDTLNYLLSEVSYGSRCAASGWAPKSAAQPSSVKPESSSLINVSYKTFVDQKYPFASDKAGSPAAVELNRAAKAARQIAQNTFTHRGQPGELHAPTFNALLARMHFPETRKSAAVAASTTLAPGLLADTWAVGRYFLLPSYLELLLHLQESHLLDQVRIVYRTYGQDLEEVAKELDMFAAGQHPLFPEKSLDPRLTLRRPFSSFYRHGPRSCDALIAVGTMERSNELVGVDLDSFYAIRQVQTVKGFPQISDAMNKMLAEAPNRCLGLRDHYNWWQMNGESDDSGKLLLLPTAAIAQTIENNDDGDLIRHCFIDDHIEHNRAHIVDVRCSTSAGACVPFEESINRWIFRAEPFDAILDRNYFVKLVRRIMGVHMMT